MLIDSHCHLDASKFDPDRDVQISNAQASGVSLMVIPSVSAQNFDKVIQLSQQHNSCCYALGWHPMMIDQAHDDALIQLEAYIESNLKDEKFVAIGEIGLDFFVTKDNVAKQTHFFTEQLKLAQTYDLPVILHVRKAIDAILKQLRRHPVRGGIAHAFNGSEQQAQMLIDLGFKLGFGGAVTYHRALKIRALVKHLDLNHIVLETDAPDMPPEWLGHGGRNSPNELMKIAQVLADIKGISQAEVVKKTSKNCCEVLPKIGHLYTPLQVLH